MKIQLQYKLKRGEPEKIPIPNFKTLCLLPISLEFSVTELEFTLQSLNNPLLKYGESYFRIFNHIDLADYRNKIGKGDDLTMIIKNTGKKEVDLGITINYEKQLGNIIYMNTYYNNQPNFDKCLEDFDNAGHITNLIIEAEKPIQSIILDPYYKLSPQQESEDFDIHELSNWSGALVIQNEEPSTRGVIDFMDRDLQSYVRFLKFYRLKIVFAGEEQTNDKNTQTKIFLVGYGYKSDKR